MTIFAAIPPIAWLIWRAAKPYMLCRDVEAGAITKDALYHLLFEGAIYIAAPLLLIIKEGWNTPIIALFMAMFLIGLSGIFRTAISFYRIKKASNKALQAIGAKTRLQPER